MKILYPLALLAAASLFGCTPQKQLKEFEVKDVANPAIILNGTWKFSMIPPENYWENDLDFQDWSDIRVPGECQMQGFAIQHDRPYVYKIEFEVPADYEGKEVYLNFYGVYSYARVWVNGEYIREHSGGFTKWTCDIGRVVTPGEKAVLTVEIMDRSDDISYGSGYAKHQIGGILRDVELVALPPQHFKQLYVETELDDRYTDAELKILYKLQRDTPARIKVELFDTGNKLVKRLERELDSQEGIISIPVSNPEKWDAEHPNLYTLSTTLIEGDRETLTQSLRIGFREVEVNGNSLLVNGRPVKLRGACRHDIHPALGRMTTPEYDLKDVLLAKECNMNFIRTSHYPPSEAFLDYCDQYGIYVEDETAVCFVGSHRTEVYRSSGATQDDEEFTGRYMSQLEEMVQNHRNHPSVIIWSIGNENVFGKNFTKSFQWVKSQDATRPVIYSYPGQVPDSLRNYEILSMHYPNWQGNLVQYGMETKAFEYKQMPALFDEWAHVSCYNNFELKEDPNVRSFWGQSLDSMWTYTFEADGALGGAIWCMLDETFMLPEDLDGFTRWWGILDKNVIPASYMGPCVGYGEWGIVDTWRRKKPEFWATKKAYSPARLLVKQLDKFEPGKELVLPVHNRFDHTNLNELLITWDYAGLSGKLENHDLEPHSKGELLIPACDWKAGEKVHVSFYRNDTLLVDRYALLLGKRAHELAGCVEGELEVSEMEDRIHIKGSGFKAEINKSKGLLENLIAGEDTLISSGPYINLRVPGIGQQYSTLPMHDLARNWSCTDFWFNTDNGIVNLYTKGTYKGLNTSFHIKIDQKGLIEIAYEVSHTGMDKNVQEAGLKFLTGNSFIELAWDRNSYFTVYPENHPGRPTGKADLRVRPEMRYRQKPQHEWEMDTKGFYYFGLEEELPYTNLARSLKENIYEYVLRTDSNTGLRVISEGSQACRFDQIKGKNTLIINDSWDYNSLLWGNYMKQIPVEKSFNGQAMIELIGLI
ncbi:MAG: glycoside hydrolase family 2 TIM barrel-domain containing protein [Bacteroidota bacterium]